MTAECWCQKLLRGRSAVLVLAVSVSDTLVSVVQRGAGGSSVRLQSADTALSDRAGGDGAEVAGTGPVGSSVSVAPGGDCRHHQSPG